MRLAVLFVFAARPALAHHEVVAAASMLPVYFGLAAIAVAGVGAARVRLARIWRGWWRR